MDYGYPGVEGVSLAYWEIARAFNLGKSPFAAHIEYNGGFLQAGIPIQINDAYLGGIEYNWNAKDFSRGFTLQVLYKTIRGKNNTSFQLTGVWYLNLCKDKVSLSGFADFWKEDNIFADGSVTKFVFLSEPQFWYNFNKNMSVGSEVELGYNFTGNYTKGFHVCPTAAVKYTF